MQLEGITVALRTRTPWEATDLGIALVRTHAARIYAAWALITLPAVVVLNALAWFVHVQWLAALAFWWLKPVFDRVPLYVISRAVFGPAPTLREVIAAQRTWAWRGVVPWLLWRRLHPGRAMLLPVDLLEGAKGTQRRERVYVLSRAHASPNMMLTLIGINLEVVFYFALIALGLMFVPSEFFSESAKAVWQTLFEDPPQWALVAGNFMAWFAESLVEPFYIGAGFGLYLNRRMQLEAWDIELAFRRMAARLTTPLATAALLLAAVLTLATASHAAEQTAPTQPTRGESAQGAAPDAESTPKKSPGDDAHKKPCPNCLTHASIEIDTTLRKLFADGYRDDAAKFASDVTHAYDNAELKPTTKQSVWKRRHPLDGDAHESSNAPAWAKAIGGVIGFVAQYGLWILIALLLTVIVANHRRWLPWLSDRVRAAPAPERIEVHESTAPERLPADVVSAVRALLQRGRVRAALALFYRAAVERLIEQLGAPLPPGATESECLRQARRLHDMPYPALFARIVRCWQTAAYAQRLPAGAEVEALLVEWSAPAGAAP